jgi:hypothetical protein
MGFLAVYPIILGYCRKAFRGCNDREELTAEAVAVAYIGWLAIQKKGKTVSPLSIAYYAVRRARSKRRTFSPNCKRDATRLRRLPVHADFFLDLAGDSDPVEEAVLRVDFRAYLDTLPRLKRRACRMFLDGERTAVVARRLRVTPGRVSQMRRELVEGWDLFTL